MTPDTHCPKCGAMLSQRFDFVTDFTGNPIDMPHGEIECLTAQLAERDREIERLREACGGGWRDDHDRENDNAGKLREALRRIRRRVREMNNTPASREWAYDELLALIALFPKEKE